METLSGVLDGDRLRAANAVASNDTGSTQTLSEVAQTPAPRRRAVWVALTAIAVVGAVVVSVLALRQPQVEPTTNDLGAAVEEVLANATPAPANAALVYSTIAPSFVVVQVDRDADESSGGLGSGVVVNASGDIVTARHVITNADAITVIFSDGTASEATVMSSDPDRDIATLSAATNPDVVVPAVLGDISTMYRGDPVYAIGNPLGLSGSISSGVVSGFNRSVPLSDGSELEGLIQFDAAVNPGSSGGPLVNSAGQVIGIVNALANPADTESFSGVGFAVPMGLALSGALGGGPAQ